MSDFNAKVIKEFRENDGIVGGYFENQTVLLLHTTGAKTGKERINPLLTTSDGDRHIIIASAGGSDKHPSWYYNLVANPVVSVEVGTDQYQARAIVTEEPERTELYDKMIDKNSVFAEYREKANREIPVIALERIQE